jgi:hypothetical protein
MNREGHRYAFLVGIAIGLIVNMGLLPWFQRGQGEAGGVRIGLSPLATAMAEQAPETAMASAFRALGLPYVEGQTVLVGDDASMTYFDATTQAALLASGGVIGPSYDVRLTLAYMDTQDLSAMVVSATQAALAGSASPPPAGIDASAITAHVTIVAGTLDSGSTTVAIVGAVSTLEYGGHVRTSLTVRSVHETEADALAEMNWRPGGPFIISTPDFRPLDPTSPQPDYQKTDCWSLESESERCACDFNWCSYSAFETYRIAVDDAERDLAICAAVALASAFAGIWSSVGAGLLWLAIMAFCTLSYLSKLETARNNYEIAMRGCQRDIMACLRIYEH